MLESVTRVVVKLGTGVLTDEHKQLDPTQMGMLVGQVATQRRAGREVVIVTSGAVGAGMGALGFERRPSDLASLQACAAVGQSRLMTMYDRLFAKHDLHVAQVLLTHDDLEDRDRRGNARNTLLTLLRRGVVPIINENDAVSCTELKFGDNDQLSALVATLLPAHLLVILTTVDGVMENFGRSNARVISTIEKIDASLERLAGGTDSPTAVGGMKSKLQAARIVGVAGVPLVIASGRRGGTLSAVMRGEEEGTLFLPKTLKHNNRRRRDTFFTHPRGSIFVDDGAKAALRERASLLLPGVTRCQGAFAAGDIVSICDAAGTEFARGIARGSAAEVAARELPRKIVVHRNDLVVL